jgi:hypothetical protein
MIILIVLVSLISIIFIEFEMNDYAMYKEAFLVSQEIIKMTHITNTFTYSGFIKVAELFDTWPEIPNHDEVGKIKHDFIKISTNNYDNILELIIDSKKYDLKYLVVDRNNEFFDDLRINQSDYNYLHKIDLNNFEQITNYSIYEINYEILLDYEK